MVDEEARRAYLNRPPPFVQLAERRNFRRTQWGLSATTFAVMLALAAFGGSEHIRAAFDDFAELIGSLCAIQFLLLAVGIFARGFRCSAELPPQWGPLLLSSAAFWLWIAISKDAFVRPVDLWTLIGFAALWCAAWFVACTLLGLAYVVGRLFRPGERKEIN